jgi:soluble lytic murein transglycosylase-like protein
MTSMIPTTKCQGYSCRSRRHSAVYILLLTFGFSVPMELLGSAVPKASSVPSPRTSPKSAIASKAKQPALPKLDDLIELNGLLSQKQYSAAEMAIVKAASTKWPAPFQVLLRDHAQALLHLAPAAKLPDQFTQANAADRQKSAEYLGLIAVDKPAATPGAPKPAVTLPPGELAKPTLALLKSAWSQGLTSDAQRIAAKARLAPHGKNCNGFWAYSQWVLGRLARSAQNRKDFYKYQSALGDHLLNNACTHQNFEMTQAEFRDFRRAELLWAARLLWENEELRSAQKDAESVLEEIVQSKDPKDSGVLLEAVQVLFGRIRYESESPDSNIAALVKLRKQLADAGLLAPALAEYIALRSALLAFEIRDYKLCAAELTSSSAAQKAAPAEVFDSPAGRRNYTQHQYWLAKCSSLSGEENAEAIVRGAWDEIHRYGATGYYAMLIEQDFPGFLVESAQEDESTKEFSISDEISPGLPPDAVNDLVNIAAMISESQKLGELPRSSMFWQAPTSWAVGTIKGNERALFDSNPSALTNAWDMLLAAERAADVILGAGKLAQRFRLDHPKAHMIRKFLYPRVFQETFAEASEKCSVDPLLLYSVARQESLFNPKATSPAGARGLVQLMPSVWAKLLKEHPEWGLSDNPFDLRSNVILGACHLRDSLAIFRGNTALSLAGYNAGTSVVESWFRRRFRGDFPLFFESIPFAETQDYVKQITRSIYHAQKVWDRSPISKRAKPN